MSLWDKEHAARKRFLGKKVRRQFSTGPYSECVRVKAHGPPSGWTVTYEIRCANRSSFLVGRMNEVEIKP